MRVHRRLSPLRGRFVFSFFALFFLVILAGCSESGKSNAPAKATVKEAPAKEAPLAKAHVKEAPAAEASTGKASVKKAPAKAVFQAPVKGAAVYAVGDRAVDFTIKTFDGGEFSLASHAGSPVLINFWASWCGPCRIEGPLLESLYNKYKDRGIVFVGVAIQDSEKGSRAYLKEFGWTFPTGPDSDGTIADYYAVMGIPKTVIIKRDGTVSYMQSGVMPEAYLAGKIEAVLGQ